MKGATAMLFALVSLVAFAGSGCFVFSMYMQSAKVHYPIPDVDKVQVTRDIVYREDNGERLLLDVYRPANSKEPLPAVLMIHGSGPQFMLNDAKDWGTFTGFGKILAGRGYAAVAFTHRGSMDFGTIHRDQGDVTAVVDYVRSNAKKLGIDPEKICLWAYSAGGVYLSPFMWESPQYVRGIVSYYAIMDLQPMGSMLADSLSQQDIDRFSAVKALQKKGAAIPPTLVVKAGLDREDLNLTIDNFVKTAKDKGAPVQMLEHVEGKHGFDVFNDDQRTREIIKKTLEFIDGVMVDRAASSAPDAS